MTVSALSRFGASVFALALLSAPLAAVAAPSIDPAAMPAGEYVLDKTHASVVGTVSHDGFSHYTFRFDTVDASYLYDPKAPAASKITVTIDAKSLNTGWSVADQQFPAEFLAAETAPKITFVSTAIQLGAGGKGKVVGNLTLAGVTKPVTLDVTYNGYGEMMGGNRAGFSAVTTVKRSAFGSTKYQGMIGDDVSLTINAEFTKK